MKEFFSGVMLLLGEIGINDIIDILIVAFILYKLFIFIRDSRAQLLFKAVLLILGAFAIAYVLKLQMVTYIIDLIARNAAIAIIVIMQPELRSVLERVGRSKLPVNALFGTDEDERRREQTLATIENVVESAKVLQRRCMGALIVFERQVVLNDIVEHATAVDGTPSVGLITNLFFNKAPLHDGAVVIRDNRVCAAGCILPMTKKTDIDSNLGTRHRAAIGMSENSDAVVVVVSEETGRLSVCVNGVISSSFDPEELAAELKRVLVPPKDEEQSGGLLTRAARRLNARANQSYTDGEDK